MLVIRTNKTMPLVKALALKSRSECR